MQAGFVQTGGTAGQQVFVWALQLTPWTGGPMRGQGSGSRGAGSGPHGPGRDMEASTLATKNKNELDLNKKP